jgi:hypothetical protein
MSIAAAMPGYPAFKDAGRWDIRARYSDTRAGAGSIRAFGAGGQLAGVHRVAAPDPSGRVRRR